MATGDLTTYVPAGDGGDAVGSGARSRQSLAEAFSPRHNSLALLRLGLAALVAVAHALLNGFGYQPTVGVTYVADLAVDGFFVLSGFLVARSYLRLRSPGRYAWHRFLRIMPGFWVCLVVIALVVAPLAAVLAGRPAASVLTGEDPAWGYVVFNAGLPMLQEGIAGIRHTGDESVMDGSLWTLAYEAFCYVVLAVLGLAAVLHRRPWVVPLLAGLAWVGAAADDAGLLPADVPLFDNHNLLRFLVMFLLGVTGLLYADRLPIRWYLALGSGAVVLGGMFLPDYRIVGAVCFAYLALYAVVRLPLRWTPAWDLSYGLYIYHWPIQVLLVLAGVTAVGQAGFVLISVVATLVVAAVSWLLVEGPALRLKDAQWGPGRPGVRRAGGAAG